MNETAAEVNMGTAKMYTTVRELRRCHVQGIDREAGAVADILVDDRSWYVRYVVADTGSWLRHHRVLLTPNVLGKPDPDYRTLVVSLSADDIERRPPVDADPPVAAVMERRLHDVVSLAGSWVMGFGEPPIFPLTAPAPGVHYPVIVTPWPMVRSAHEGDRHLRSAAHLLGDHVMALDGPAGSVEDFVIDDDWRVTDVVVHLRGRRPVASVLVPTRWVGDVSWGMRMVRINVPLDRLGPAATRASGGRAGRRPPSVQSS